MRPENSRNPSLKNSCVKPSANLNETLPRPDAPAGRAGRGRVLNLMKETLTVRLAHSAALAEGDRRLRAYESLIEHGTDEEIWADAVLRGAAVRWDIMKRRALAPAVEPTNQERMTHAEGLLRRGEIKPWGESPAQNTFTVKRETVGHCW